MPTMKTARERAGFRGPVQFCEDFEGEAADPTYRTGFAVDGKLLVYQDSSGSSDTVSFYDNTGRLTGVLGGDRRDENLYDEQGRRTSVRIIHPRPGPEGQRAIGVDAIFEVAEQGRQLVRGGIITTRYNEDDQPTESLIHGARGELLVRIVHEYDSDGHLVRDSLVQESFEVSDSLIPEELRSRLPADIRQILKTRTMKALKMELGWPESPERSYVYNQRGQLTEWHMKVRDFRKDATLNYNERGDVVRTVVLRSGGFPDMPVSDERLESEFVYQYDERGNWIEQKTRTLGKAGEPISEESVRRRMLTYY